MWWNGATNAVYAYEMALDSAANAARRLASYTGGSGAPAYSVSGTVGKQNTTTPQDKHKYPTSTINKGGNYASTKRISVRHRGIDAGLIGGNAKGNEEFVKALKGEAFVTKAQQDKFMSKILPKMISTNTKDTGRSVVIQKLMDITVKGNLDKTVIPDINDIADRAVRKLNETMFRNGFNKSTSTVAI